MRLPRWEEHPPHNERASYISLTRPSGGLVLWVRLPEPVDSLELYKKACKAAITLAPDYVFSPTQQVPNFIRLNAAEFSCVTGRAVERLGGMIADLSSKPA